jgi:hypothetical protein
VTLFTIAVAAGLAAGYARGGRLGRLGQLRLRAPALAGLALAMQAGAGLVSPSGRFAVVAVSYALVGTWLVLNLGRRCGALRLGVGLLAVGWVLNGVAIAPHRGMPVSHAAMERAGFSPAEDVTDGHLFKHVPDGRTTAVDWLGDVIPVRSLGAVVSVGDLALLAGVAVCVAAAMASPRTVQAPRNSAAGVARHRRRDDRAWREPAPPGDDGGAKAFDPHVVLAGGGVTLEARGAS